MLSKILEINKTNITQTIDEKFIKYYSSLINEHKIKEKLLLKNTNLTYNYIDFEVINKSKSVFNSAFKTCTKPTFSIFDTNALIDN